MLAWFGLSSGKYYDWRKRRNREIQHNGSIPKSHWILPWENQAIIAYRLEHIDEGYYRLCFMMLDENVVAVSPSTVYRALKCEGLLNVKWRHHKARGSGFVQPTKPHEHWHLDISYINFKGTFVYLVCLVDGYSRYVVHFELRTSIEALDVEIMLERARENYPGTSPILITDNGPQFIAKEFKLYLKDVGITHRKTRFFYPQSNGKIERFYQTCKNELIRKKSFLNLDDLKNQLAKYIDDYNTKRLHSSLGYITPEDMLLGHREEIFAQRKEKLKRARDNRIKQRALLIAKRDSELPPYNKDQLFKFTLN